MAGVAGISGSITWASGYSSKVTAWTINMAGEEVEYSSMEDDWKRWLPGLKEWSGTFDTIYDTGQLDSGTTVGQSGGGTGMNLALGVTPASATFLMTTGEGFTGNIIITGVDVTHSLGESGKMSFTFRGDNNLQTV